MKLTGFVLLNEVFLPLFSATYTSSTLITNTIGIFILEYVTDSPNFNNHPTLCINFDILSHQISNYIFNLQP